MNNRLVDLCCIAQFIITFLLVHVFCYPLSKFHVAVIGLSAVMGLFVSSAYKFHSRRNSPKHHRYEDRADYAELEKTLEKIRRKDEIDNSGN